MDKGESPEQAALRELKEETGYVGRAVHCSGMRIQQKRPIYMAKEAY